MRSVAVCAGALLVSATLLLSGCGGGGSDNPPPPNFDIGVLLNGHPVTGVDVFPGDEQTLYVTAGQTFELDSSGPVSWTLVVAGSTIAGAGNTISYGGATLQEILTTASQFAAITSEDAPLPAPVPITLYATSLDDSSQVARFNIVITN